MKKILFLVFFSSLSYVVLAQSGKFYTNTGQVSFVSVAPLETIESYNNQVQTIYMPATRKLAFKVLIKSFMFKKSVMQEHFNTNYMHSNTFPNATFEGEIIAQDGVDFTKNGNYKVQAEGDITIHGVTKKIVAMGELIVKDKSVSIKSSFPVQLDDYEVKIPANFVSNISKTVQVNVACELLPK